MFRKTFTLSDISQYTLQIQLQRHTHYLLNMCSSLCLFNLCCVSQVLKLYAWEGAFQGKLADLRRIEISHMLKAAFYVAGMSISLNCVPILVSYLYVSCFFCPPTAAIDLYNYLSPNGLCVCMKEHLPLVADGVWHCHGFVFIVWFSLSLL